jgi:nucleotide-binding universal stress UspA family protein
MNTLERIMVGLDLSEMDDTLIRYAAFLCSQTPVEKVYFIHVEKSLELPQQMDAIEKSGLAADESLCQLLEAKVLPHFEPISQVKVEVQVVEGNPLKELLHWSKIKEVDMVLVGRKLRLRGSGVLPHMLLRNGRVSVLFVPEHAVPVLRRIVVSIDFSEYARVALEHVLHTVIRKPGIEVMCLYIYHVPTGYITLGIPHEEFEERMRGFAYEKFDRVLEQFPELGSRASLKLVKEDDTSNLGEQIVLEAKRARADMLAIGAKGKTAAALFVLGSVTEKILRYDSDIPLIVFKKGNEQLSYLDALIGE